LIINQGTLSDQISSNLKTAKEKADAFSFAVFRHPYLPE
jgi:hypothetical protein